jgi:DNA (cytosine-5)-methyltransferase 1
LNVSDNTGDVRATVLIFYGNRVDDIRIQGDVINTLQARMGTGGGNMPIVYGPKSAFEENWAESEVKNALRANASKSSHAVVQSTVRRLTPIECERLQGFPDGWTEGQADTHRYKQMGNAVAVPVVSWLAKRLIGVANDMD